MDIGKEAAVTCIHTCSHFWYVHSLVPRPETAWERLTIRRLPQFGVFQVSVHLVQLIFISIEWWKVSLNSIFYLHRKENEKNDLDSISIFNFHCNFPLMNPVNSFEKSNAISFNFWHSSFKFWSLLKTDLSLLHLTFNFVLKSHFRLILRFFQFSHFSGLTISIFCFNGWSYLGMKVENCYCWMMKSITELNIWSSQKGKWNEKNWTEFNINFQCFIAIFPPHVLNFVNFWHSSCNFRSWKLNYINFSIQFLYSNLILSCNFRSLLQCWKLNSEFYI